MRRSRRQIVIRVIEKVAIGLVLLDLALYFGVLRQVQNWVASEEQRYAATRLRVREESERVERLEKFQASLPGAGEKIQAFKRDHVPPRRHGFSQAARLLRRVSDEAGVQLVGPVVYKLDSEHDKPLERLGFLADAQGSFADLMKFAHGLETAPDLILIHEFSFEAGEGGELSLRLAADLYMTP